MRSMISSSERALARSDFRRFWPLLFGYAVLWLCALPLSLWSRHDYLSSRRPMEAMASVSNYFYNASRASIYVSAFFAVLLAMALFAYLMNSRSVGLMHLCPSPGAASSPPTSPWASSCSRRCTWPRPC